MSYLYLNVGDKCCFSKEFVTLLFGNFIFQHNLHMSCFLHMCTVAESVWNYDMIQHLPTVWCSKGRVRKAKFVEYTTFCRRINRPCSTKKVCSLGCVLPCLCFLCDMAFFWSLAQAFYVKLYLKGSKIFYCFQPVTISVPNVSIYNFYSSGDTVQGAARISTKRDNLNGL